MTKQEREKKRQLMRVAIPAAVCVVAIVAIAMGTRVFQQGIGSGVAQGLTPPMELRGQWLGMRLASTGSQSAAELGIPPEIKGVVVSDVQASSRALFAGLSPGDVVARINGKDVANIVDMYALSAKLDPARPLQVDILRGGRPMTVLVPPDGMMPATAAWSMGGRAPGWAPAAAQMNVACPNCTMAP